jgi:hypothetical protein
MSNLAIDVALKETFEEVTGTFHLDKYAPKGNFRNHSIFEKMDLEQELGVNVEQIGLFDFIDIAFPRVASAGYFCFFQKGETKKRHVFYSRKELQETLASMLEKTFYWNCYISYSTYYKAKPEYFMAPQRIKFKDGTFAKACDLKTKKEYFITQDVRKMKPRRTQKNITYTYLLVQDLDYYKYGISNGEAIKRIAQLVRDKKIICPTFFLFTGRGIQLVWALQPFKNIKGYTRDKEWRAIQDNMIEIFKEVNLYPDTVVKNPSAVTRTTETYNRAAKDVVRTFYVNAAKLTLDDFTFHHQLIPQPDKKVEPKRSQQPAVIIEFPLKKAQDILEEVKREWKEHHHINDKILDKMNWNLETLNESRVDDIFTYVKVLKERENQSLFLKTRRNWLVLVAVFHKLVATNGDAVKAYNTAVELWNEFDEQDDTTLDEIVRRGYDQAVEKYNDWVNDSWNKETYVQGGLFYNTKRLLELMEITEDYEMQYRFKTIKIRNKAYEAFKKRAERHGLEEAEKHTKKAYLEGEQEKTDERLWQLKTAKERHPKAKQQELADMLGISLSYVKKLVKKLKQL